MKRVKTFNQFVNESKVNEGKVKVPKELEKAIGETSEMEPGDYDSGVANKIKAAQKKYQWVIDDYAANDIIGMTIDQVKSILSKKRIKFEEINADDSIIVMF